MDLKDPTIKTIQYSNIDKIPIAEIDIDFYRKLSFINTHYEVELETCTNSLIELSVSNDRAQIFNSKQINSDGFHYWLNKETFSTDFVFITEYKRGRLSNCGYLAALTQAIFYYYKGTLSHKNDDKVKYLVIICEDTEKGIQVIDVDSNRELINQICAIFNRLEIGGYKLTGSTVYEKCPYINDALEDAAIISKVLPYSSKGILDAILYMRNDFESNRDKQ